MTENSNYILKWDNPSTGEAESMPLNDLSISLAYKIKKQENGMENVEVYSRWNKGIVLTTKMKIPRMD